MERANEKVKAGQEIRMIELRVELPNGKGAFECLHGENKGKDFAEKLYKAIQDQHGTAGPAFVGWLVEMLTYSPDYISKIVGPKINEWLRRYASDAEGQVARGSRRFAIVGVAGELATEAGITGWQKGAAEAAAAELYRIWKYERGGLLRREDYHLILRFKTYMAEHRASRFETVTETAVVGDSGENDLGRTEDKKAQDQEAELQKALPNIVKTMNMAGWRWRVRVQCKKEDGSGTSEHYADYMYGFDPIIFARDIAEAEGSASKARDARQVLGKAGLIVPETQSDGTKKWAWRPKRVNGKRPLMIVVDPRVFDGDEEGSEGDHPPPGE